MDLDYKTSGFKLRSREKRMLFYLVVVLGFAAWKFIPRPWHPAIREEYPHHFIESNATRAQTHDVARVLEILYGAYSNRFGTLPKYQREHPLLKVKLFKDRAEFRRINPGLAWAEAFYREPYCRAYYSANEVNPYHWMVHESVHQLNNEVARVELEKWLEEGLADYFGTSRFSSNSMLVGTIDLNTYPVWWLDELATGPDLEENIRNKSVIRLRAIVTNSGGPSLNSHFNLYYLHWWTLTHFVFEHPSYGARTLDLLKAGGRLEAFERLVGPIELVEKEWHAHVRQLKAQILLPARRNDTPMERP